MLVTDAMVVRSTQRPQAAFADHYARYYPLIFAYVLRRIGDWTAAEDITAHTFARAFQALGRYEERGAPFDAWLMRIATNALTDEFRRRRSELSAQSAMRAAGGGGPDLQQEDWLAGCEKREWLGTHLGCLSTVQRRALWLRFGTDCTVREVAAELGRSEGATKALLRRALRRLRVQMLPEAL
jgi:RNA polymerase sigma-70 factor (ECF subfamily)